MKNKTGAKVKVSATKMSHDLHDIARNVAWVQENLGEESETSADEIKQCIAQLDELKWKMKAHIIFRKLVSQVFEAILLVDRLLYARQKGWKCALDWGLNGLSGRGIIVFAQK